LGLIEIMNQEKTDPLLLTAVCQFSLDLFETTAVSEDGESIFYTKIGNLLEVLPVLGGSKYMSMLESTLIYFKNEDDPQDNNKDEDESIMNRMTDDENNSDEVSSTDSEDQREEKIRESLNHLNNEIMIKLMEKIVTLIELFSRMANSKSTTN
jgi:hypothetical protein